MMSRRCTLTTVLGLSLIAVMSWMIALIGCTRTASTSTGAATGDAAAGSEETGEAMNDDLAAADEVWIIPREETVTAPMVWQHRLDGKSRTSGAIEIAGAEEQPAEPLARGMVQNATVFAEAEDASPESKVRQLAPQFKLGEESAPHQAERESEREKNSERYMREHGQASSNRPEHSPEAEIEPKSKPSLEQTLADVGAGTMLARVTKTVADNVDAQPDDINATELLPMPLQSTEVSAHVSGFIASVGVKQHFANPFDTKIEAVYVFPLPQDSAVTDFIMVIGERTIRGIIRETEEAERIYAHARQQGHVASLLTQQRPNIFTQKVANIEPGKAVDIELTYFQPLQYADGSFEFRFPMTIGPRYNPGGWKDPVHATGHGSPAPSGGGGTNITYLEPNQVTGHRVKLSLTVDAGLPIAGFTCPSHQVEHSVEGERVNHFVLAADEDGTVPDRDFVLRYTLAGEGLRTTMLTRRDGDSEYGHFALMAYPPEQMLELPEQPLEMIFLIDRSGSMSGVPLDAVKTAMLKALDHMTPADAVQIVVFSSGSQPLFKQPMPATPANVAKARQFIESLQANGGTEMLPAVQNALGMGPSIGDGGERMRFVCLMTDGYIGNEVQIVQAIHNDRGEVRVMSFGVGSSPNDYLITRAAKSGRGVAAYLGLEDDGSATMDAFWQRVRRPALSQLELKMDGAEAIELAVHRLPDIFVGRPVVITGRYTGARPQRAVLTGLVGGKDVEIEVPVIDEQAPAERSPLAKLWARQAIATLNDEMAVFPDRENQLRPAVIDLALNHDLMSTYTAFVAVDSAHKTEGGYGVSMQQPLPVPHGVRYDTTVGE